MTLVKQACVKVAGFEDFHKRLSRKIRVAGKSDSTLNCYTRHLAAMALHSSVCLSSLTWSKLRSIWI
jgi:hypothetical protein